MDELTEYCLKKLMFCTQGWSLGKEAIMAGDMDGVPVKRPVMLNFKVLNSIPQFMLEIYSQGTEKPLHTLKTKVQKN